MQKIDSKLGETTMHEASMHEAAHAVVAVKVGCGLAENGVVTIEPGEFHNGYVCVKHQSAEQDILVTLAGGVASAASAHEKQWVTSVDAQIIAHDLNRLHPSKHMAALEWLVFELNSKVFELNSKVGMPLFASTETSRGAFLALSEVEKEYAKLHADLYVFALIILCNSNDSTTARQVISLNTAIPYDLRMTLLGTPWFKTLSDSTDKVRDLLDEHGDVVSALADRLLEVRTMTGTEAEKFIREAA